jgi:hypothetical protein
METFFETMKGQKNELLKPDMIDELTPDQQQRLNESLQQIKSTASFHLQLQRNIYSGGKKLEPKLVTIPIRKENRLSSSRLSFNSEYLQVF